MGADRAGSGDADGDGRSAGGPLGPVRRGRGWPTGGTDAWSETVDDLLRVTAGQVFTHRSADGAGQPRHTSAAALSIFDQAAPDLATIALDLPPPAPGAPDRRGPGDGGISTVYIALRRA